MKKPMMCVLLALMLVLTGCGSGAAEPETTTPEVLTDPDTVVIQLENGQVLVEEGVGVSVANDIIYYESGHDFTYGEGEDEYYDIYTYPEYEDDWAALSEELRTEAGRSILAKVATPFAYLFAPISGQASWELAASSITGFIAKENVVGTLQVCFGVPNRINDDFEIIGDGAGLKEAFGIGAVAALAYLMFNLFTPPCFAAMGAMNAEIKSKKWLFAGIALQFGIGYSIAFLVNFFGSLFTG